MKTSITNSKSKFLLLAVMLVPSLAQAKLVGKVHALKGDAFVIFEGKTQALKKDMDIEEGSQVMVSDESQVTVGDFYDRRFHLSSGTHWVMHDKSSVLQKGSVWSQSYTAKTSTAVQTANMLLNSYQGEYIITYSVAEKKSQLTVVAGEVDVASPSEPAFRYAVMAGQFTTAQPDFEDGYPRSPTQIGYDSLMSAVRIFPGVKSQDAGVAKAQASSASRGIASVSEKKGEIIYMRTVVSGKRAPASVSGEAQSYFLKKTQKAPSKPTIAKVRVLGYQEVKAPSARNPASTHLGQPKDQALSVNDADFLKSYQLRKQEQPKHSKEVQRLIDDLKSY